MTLPTSLRFDGFCDGFTNVTQVSRFTDSTPCDAATFCSPALFNAQAGGPIGRSRVGGSILGQGAALTIETYPAYGVSVTVLGKNDGTWTAGTLATLRGSKTIFSR